MATSRKVLREELKSAFLDMIIEYFNDNEQVLRVGSNEIAIPIVDREGNEDFLVITVKIPTGSRDGEVYDGYAMQEEYQMKLKEKAEKAKVTAEAKKKKIARDTKMREEKEQIRQNKLKEKEKGE